MAVPVPDPGRANVISCPRYLPGEPRPVRLGDRPARRAGLAVGVQINGAEGRRGAAAPPFMVMDVIAAANAQQAALPAGAGRVIRMEVGQPGTGAPAGAVAAAQAALGRGEPLGYTEALGRPSLRARIAAHYAEWYGLALPAERVAVTTGASGAFPLAFLAAFDAGDRVALTAPFYPPYVNILTALGMRRSCCRPGRRRATSRRWRCWSGSIRGRRG